MENVVRRNMSGEGFTAKKLAFIGLFGAVASVLMFLEFPLPFAPGFYKLDLSEVPVLIGAFALGPVSGFFIELIKILVHLVIKGTQTAGIGELANLVIGCAFVLPAALIYRAGKTRKRAVIGMITGTLVMTVAGCFHDGCRLLYERVCAASRLCDGFRHADGDAGGDGNRCQQSGSRCPDICRTLRGAV